MQERDLASLPHQRLSFQETSKWLEIPAEDLVKTMFSYRKWAKIKREVKKSGLVLMCRSSPRPNGATWLGKLNVRLTEIRN
jgi:hypothetical protein